VLIQIATVTLQIVRANYAWRVTGDWKQFEASHKPIGVLSFLVFHLNLLLNKKLNKEERIVSY
jgi:hypothetical protein